MSESQQPGRPTDSSAWRQIVGGIVGGVIVLATVLGSILLATQEAPPPTPTAVVIVSPSATPFVIDVTPPPSATPAPSPTPIPPTSPPTAACPVPAGWSAYTVRAGDTLSSIARSFSTNEFLLIQGNCLTETNLAAGQIIYVPPPPTRGPTPIPTPCGPPPTWVIYYVQRGDTLYGLSVRYRTTVAALAQANCLTTYALRVGQRLYVPPVTPPPPPATATFTPLPSETPIPSETPTSTLTPAASDTPTPTPSETPIVTWTPQPTDTPSPTITPSPTDTPIPTDTPSPTVAP